MNRKDTKDAKIFLRELGAGRKSMADFGSRKETLNDSDLVIDVLGFRI